MIDLAWLQKEFPEVAAPRRIGRGGQKEVFAGLHAQDGDVVLKIFHLGADQERLVREIKAAQDVPSARVPSIYEFGSKTSPIGDVLWVREQFIAGESLREVLARGPLPNDAVLRLALQMIEPLAAAERVRIVHRDVKPDNILAAADGSYWLLDFGLARHLDMDSLTATAFPFGVGTPGYAAPEQMRNRKDDIDGRADLFGLGVTLYEAVEGVNPLRHGARDGLEMVRRSETMALPRITRKIDTADEFSELIQAMTRIQRDHRPASAEAALDWIREVCGREGIT